MTPTRMIVLANSWKHGDYCLAGIDIRARKWVRPVTDLADGRVPIEAMKLNGYFPKLLDVVQLPLAEAGPDFGFACENRSILPGKWSLLGQVKPRQIMQFVEKPRYILHGSGKTVKPSALKKMPFERRRTLQLVLVEGMTIRSKNVLGVKTWMATIQSGGKPLEVNVTDPAFSDALNNGGTVPARAIITVSLGMPYKPSDWPKNAEPACWKIIAAVIEAPLKVSGTDYETFHFS